MAGPIVKIIAQAVVMGISVLARAIPAAYGAALQNAKKGGIDTAKAGENIMGRKRMKLDEALMILNLEKDQVTADSVKKVRVGVEWDKICVYWWMYEQVGSLLFVVSLFVIIFVSIINTTQQYERYFAANAVEKGGSFYLQSKIYRAKEQLDEFIQEKENEQRNSGK